MGGYTNGNYPLRMMVHLGGDHYLPAGTAARWRWLQRAAWEKYGVWLIITAGWNGYRPYNIQVQYRKDLGIWAAVPGYSSHGLIYRGQQVAAIDVANWGELGWSRFKALCRLAGFTVDFVSPQELWHIGDFNDIWTVPPFTIKPKEIRVEPYSRKDKTAREGGRTVAPGGTFRLHDALGQPTSNGRNIVGRAGPYAIVTHVYAEGTPGDSVEVCLVRYARGEKPSGHYVERAVLDRNGLARVNPGFQIPVSNGQRVFVELTALSTNTDPVKVTLLDSDAYLFTVA